MSYRREPIPHQSGIHPNWTQNGVSAAQHFSNMEGITVGSINEESDQSIEV
jgi:hypothetical protein